jgi:hypothetical protein
MVCDMRKFRVDFSNTTFDMAVGIEPTSILCLGKMWRKTFPAAGREERHLGVLKAL